MKRLTEFRILTISVLQRREVVRVITSLIDRSRLEGVLVPGELVSEDPGGPHRLLGVGNAAPGTWLGVEDFGAQVGTVAAYVIP